MEEEDVKINGNIFSGFQIKAGEYNNSNNTLALNQSGLETMRFMQHFTHARAPRLGSYDDSIIEHEEIHAFVEDKQIKLDNFKVSKIVKQNNYATELQKNESFTRELQKRIARNEDSPIYYNERKGVFTEGRFYDRVRDRLGIIH